MKWKGVLGKPRDLERGLKLNSKETWLSQKIRTKPRGGARWASQKKRLGGTDAEVEGAEQRWEVLVSPGGIGVLSGQSSFQKWKGKEVQARAGFQRLCLDVASRVGTAVSRRLVWGSGDPRNELSSMRGQALQEKGKPHPDPAPCSRCFKAAAG